WSRILVARIRARVAEILHRADLLGRRSLARRRARPEARAPGSDLRLEIANDVGMLGRDVAQLLRVDARVEERDLRHGIRTGRHVVALEVLRIPDEPPAIRSHGEHPVAPDAEGRSRIERSATGRALTEQDRSERAAVRVLGAGEPEEVRDR